MKFIDLKDIERKDSPIHYINKYNCIVVFSTDEGESEQLIEIVFEKTALGTTNIQLFFFNELLQSNMEDLEEFINEKNTTGIFD